MRLGSGRERSRCIMQFSLAAGSDRAVGRDRAGMGLGSRRGGLGQRLVVRRLQTLRESSGCPINSQFLSEAPPTTCISARGQRVGSRHLPPLAAQAFAADAFPTQVCQAKFKTRMTP